ncbi:hypothetical protein AB0H12_44250 [Actinosynnema sp. NPDC023794]
MLLWQFGADWVCDPSLETEVEIDFVEESPDRTRLELRHRHLERHGERAEALRAAFDGLGGWSDTQVSTTSSGLSTSHSRGWTLVGAPPVLARHHTIGVHSFVVIPYGDAQGRSGAGRWDSRTLLFAVVT